LRVKNDVIDSVGRRCLAHPKKLAWRPLYANCVKNETQLFDSMRHGGELVGTSV